MTSEINNASVGANLFIAALAAILIVCGVWYNPWYAAELFTNTGKLSPAFNLAVWAIDIFVIGSGVSLLVFLDYISQRISALSALLVVFLVCLGIIEGGLRLYLAITDKTIQQRFLPASQIAAEPRFVPHHYLGYYTNPAYRSPNGKDRHNSRGFRGDEIQMPKPDYVFRIAMIGGSTTYSQLVDDYQQSWPFKTRKYLNKICNSDKIEVINAGIGGYDSFQTLLNFQLRVLDLDIDMVVVHHAVNDVHARLVPPELYRGDNSGRRRPWQNDIEPWFMKLVTVRFAMTVLTGQSFAPSIGFHFDNKRSTPGVISEEFNERLGGTPAETLKKNTPHYFARNLDFIIGLARSVNVLPVLSTWPSTNVYDDYLSTPHYRAAIIEHNQVMSDAAQTNNVLLLDQISGMPTDKKYWADNRHVSVLGANRKAEISSQQLAPVVCPLLAR
jgi:hypothetical protein